MGDLFENIGRSAGRRSSASNASVISGSSTGRLRRHSRRENWFYQQQHQHDIVEEKSDRKRSTKSKRERSSKVAVFHESSHHEKSDRKMRTKSKRERSRKVAVFHESSHHDSPIFDRILGLLQEDGDPDVEAMQAEARRIGKKSSKVLALIQAQLKNEETRLYIHESKPKSLRKQKSRGETSRIKKSSLHKEGLPKNKSVRKEKSTKTKSTTSPYASTHIISHTRQSPSEDDTDVTWLELSTSSLGSHTSLSNSARDSELHIRECWPRHQDLWYDPRGTSKEIGPASRNPRTKQQSKPVEMPEISTESKKFRRSPRRRDKERRSFREVSSSKLQTNSREKTDRQRVHPSDEWENHKKFRASSHRVTKKPSSSVRSSNSSKPSKVSSHSSSSRQTSDSVPESPSKKTVTWCDAILAGKTHQSRRVRRRRKLERPAYTDPEWDEEDMMWNQQSPLDESTDNLGLSVTISSCPPSPPRHSRRRSDHWSQ